MTTTNALPQEVPPLKVNSIYLCTKHGGYGFSENCFVCKEDFGPNLKEWVALCDEVIQSKGLRGISGHNFTDYKYHRAVVENGAFKRNEAGEIIYNEFPGKANNWKLD